MIHHCVPPYICIRIFPTLQPTLIFQFFQTYLEKTFKLNLHGFFKISVEVANQQILRQFYPGVFKDLDQCFPKDASRKSCRVLSANSINYFLNNCPSNSSRKTSKTTAEISEGVFQVSSQGFIRNFQRSFVRDYSRICFSVTIIFFFSDFYKNDLKKSLSIPWRHSLGHCSKKSYKKSLEYFLSSLDTLSVGISKKKLNDNS